MLAVTCECVSLAQLDRTHIHTTASERREPGHRDSGCEEHFSGGVNDGERERDERVMTKDAARKRIEQ